MEKVIKVLEMGWEESVVFDDEVALLLKSLDIQLGELKINVKDEVKRETID